ncbi:glycosyltransferase family 9 protein [Providencia hangzhouensis]
MNYPEILIVRVGFLGNMICTTPFVLAVKNKWLDSQIHVLANKYNAPILESNPNMTCVHTHVYSKQCERNINHGKVNALIFLLVLIFKLRKIKFDIGIVPNGGMHKNSINFLR